MEGDRYLMERSQEKQIPSVSLVPSWTLWHLSFQSLRYSYLFSSIKFIISPLGVV